MARQPRGPERRWVSSAAYDMVVRTVVEARRNAGVSQAELAGRLSKPPSYVAKVELKERRLDPAEWLELLRALEASEVEAFERVWKAVVAED
jgi:ribosome-binding protein aMBF1 (putative translation factor)